MADLSLNTRVLPSGRVELSFKTLTGEYAGRWMTFDCSPDEATRTGLVLIEQAAYARLVQQAQSK